MSLLAFTGTGCQFLLPIPKALVLQTPFGLLFFGPSLSLTSLKGVSSAWSLKRNNALIL